MASLVQGLRNLKANLGTAASEMQHIANQLSMAGPDEKKFLEAVYDGKAQVAANLLTTNPNVIYARTKDWLNAWHIAAQAGNLQLLEVLYLHGRGATRKPLPGEPPFHQAKTRAKRETPIMLACANNHLTAMHYLLGVGSSPRETDKYGNTIMHYAALKGQVKMLSILLAADEGRPSEPGTEGMGMSLGLHLNTASTRLVDMRNEAGLQPLHFAVWGGQKDAVALILSYRPDLIARSITDSMAQVTCNGGSTPLHVAALRNEPPMVDMLLHEYVQVTNDGRGPRQDPRLVQDNYKFTPHALALDLRREAVVPLLDPAHALKGLDIRAAAAAAAGVTYKSQSSMRRSGNGRSREPSDSGLKKDSTPAVPEFDGFAALAAGAEKKANRASPDSPAKIVVPVLAPPPPPASKVRKANVLPPRPLPTTGSPAASPPASPAIAAAAAGDTSLEPDSPTAATRSTPAASVASVNVNAAEPTTAAAMLHQAPSQDEPPTQPSPAAVQVPSAQLSATATTTAAARPATSTKAVQRAASGAAAAARAAAASAAAGKPAPASSPHTRSKAHEGAATATAVPGQAQTQQAAAAAASAPATVPVASSAAADDSKLHDEASPMTPSAAPQQVGGDQHEAVCASSPPAAVEPAETQTPLPAGLSGVPDTLVAAAAAAAAAAGAAAVPVDADMVPPILVGGHPSLSVWALEAAVSAHVLRAASTAEPALTPVQHMLQATTQHQQLQEQEQQEAQVPKDHAEATPSAQQAASPAANRQPDDAAAGAGALSPALGAVERPCGSAGGVAAAQETPDDDTLCMQVLQEPLTASAVLRQQQAAGVLAAVPQQQDLMSQRQEQQEQQQQGELAGVQSPLQENADADMGTACNTAAATAAGSCADSSYAVEAEGQEEEDAEEGEHAGSEGSSYEHVSMDVHSSTPVSDPTTHVMMMHNAVARQDHDADLHSHSSVCSSGSASGASPVLVSAGPGSTGTQPAHAASDLGDTDSVHSVHVVTHLEVAAATSAFAQPAAHSGINGASGRLSGHLSGPAAGAAAAAAAAAGGLQQGNTTAHAAGSAAHVALGVVQCSGASSSGLQSVPSSSGSSSGSSAARLAAAASVVVVEPVPPLELCCPITNAVMEHPVVAEDGRAYEAEALEMWFSLGSAEYPAGGAPITTHDVRPADPALLQRIAEWKALHSMP